MRPTPHLIIPVCGLEVALEGRQKFRPDTGHRPDERPAGGRRAQMLAWPEEFGARRVDWRGYVGNAPPEKDVRQDQTRQGRPRGPEASECRVVSLVIGSCQCCACGFIPQGREYEPFAVTICSLAATTPAAILVGFHCGESGARPSQ